MEIQAIEYNGSPTANGYTFERYVKGDRNDGDPAGEVVNIECFTPTRRGELQYYKVLFMNGDERFIFNPSKVYVSAKRFKV